MPPPLPPLPAPPHLKPVRFFMTLNGRVVFAVILASAATLAIGIPLGMRSGVRLAVAAAPLLAMVAAMVARRLAIGRAPAAAVELESAWVEAVRLTAAGRYGEALAALDRCARHRWEPRSHANALLQIAACRLRLDRLDEALQAYASLERHVGAGLLGCRPAVAAQIALCLGLAGRTAEAEQWIEEARGRQGPEDELWMVPKAVLLAKHGEPEDAFDLLTSNWGRLDESLTSRSMRLARVLMGFAAEQSQAPQEQVDELLCGTLPAVPRDYDYLGARWPAMADFLARQGLANVGRDPETVRGPLELIH